MEGMSKRFVRDKQRIRSKASLSEEGRDEPRG